MTRPSVSVVIPTRGYSENLRAAILSVKKCGASEIIVVSKTKIKPKAIHSDRRVKLFVQRKGGISEARNLGILRSAGEVIAFTDDDCVVLANWLLRALIYFKDPKVAVVGGPGLTEPSDSKLAKCAGAVLSTSVATSTSAHRYSAISGGPQGAGERQLSTCNLFLRRKVLEDLGGFQSVLQTCEENELIERIRSAGYRVLYVPRCVVFHHRRPLFLPFLEQISTYAKGRATYSIKWPRHISLEYIVPSLLVLMTVLSPVLMVLAPLSLFLIFGIYIILAIFGALTAVVKNELGVRSIPIVFLGIVLMHYCYGVSFLIGLLNATGVSPAQRYRRSGH